jgi:hypothetical protein
MSATPSEKKRAAMLTLQKSITINLAQLEKT